uniref:Bifunctional phosphoglucose/phosphomannose isomerase n=1 Tax=candidate division WOR-3 bacterium TaxID=2052148 RepID=A0A7C4XL52_UNCW3
MKEIIQSLPDQIDETLKLMKNINWTAFRGATSNRNFERVLICGMGGSGISGEIVSALYPELDVVVSHDYEIFKLKGRRTISILISYSGNTEETITNYKILKKNRIPVITISSDGELLKRTALVKFKIPPGLPPRGALGYLFTPIPVFLFKIGMIKSNPEYSLHKLSLFLKEERGNLESRGSSIARGLAGNLPVIYSNSYPFSIVANRWRCQLNENAKILCHTNIIPEMNHNEIVGLGRPENFNKNLTIIFLNDPDAHPRNKKRVQISKEIISNGIPEVKMIDVNPIGGNLLERIFWTIMLGDFVSYFLAIENGIDPMPVKRIDYLKQRLADRK